MKAAFRLPLLEARAAALETCVYCPKLCRTACPVSNTTGDEALIPWGKMTSAYVLATGRAPLEPSHAEAAWACTGCLACRDACDHKNPVADALLDARHTFAEAGFSHSALVELPARMDVRNGELREAARVLATDPDGTELVIGCSYVLDRPDVARAIVRVAKALLGRVRVSTECCGLPLAMGGHARGRTESARRVFVDPGCAAHAGATELLLDVAARSLEAFRPMEAPPAHVRYLDPCKLGRGLGRYDAPRAILTRILGRSPDEFTTPRERTACSGGGGLLPVTMPGVARDIAAARWSEHMALGGGELVTACASSGRMLARHGGERVRDLFEWMAGALA